MKKLITLLAIVVAGSTTAQNFSTFGLLSNPENIVQNPGADPLTNFQVRYFGLQTTIMSNTTAGQILGTPDLLANLSNSPHESLNLSANIGIAAPHIGLKLGKNYLFAGATADISLESSIDNDLFRFAKYGMTDDNGDFDPNYSGDFSDTRIGMSVTQSTYFGLQRALLNNKLRVGVTYTMNNYVAGLDVAATNFSFNSTGTPGAGYPNSVTIGYDVDIASTNILDGNNIDSLNQIADNLLIDDLTSDPMGAINTGIQINTYGFGVSFRPVQLIEVQFSMNGLGAENANFAAQTSKVWSGSSSINGFSYTSSAGDSLAGEIGNSVDQFQDEIAGGISTDLTNGNYQQSFGIAQTTNAAANIYLTKRSYVGAHYASRTNTFNDFEYLGFNSMLWLGKNLQLKGGYYMSMDDVNSDLINAAIQLRITPLFQVYVGSNSVSDVATVADGILNQGGEITIGSETQGINFTAGASLTAFDKRFREEREERKMKRAEKKAQEVKSLTPAQQQQVDDAAANSSTKK